MRASRSRAACQADDAVSHQYGCEAGLEARGSAAARRTGTARRGGARVASGRVARVGRVLMAAPLCSASRVHASRHSHLQALLLLGSLLKLAELALEEDCLRRRHPLHIGLLPLERLLCLLLRIGEVCL